MYNLFVCNEAMFLSLTSIEVTSSLKVNLKLVFGKA